MKAVILAAGEGKRLKPITSTRPKPMIPIAGTPLLEHTILGLKGAGINEVLLIVGYKEEMIKNYFNAKTEDLGVRIEYITQEEYLGTAHAAGYAQDFVGKNENFLLMYGDLLVDPNIFSKSIERFNDSKAQGLITLLHVDNPQDYGIITLNSEGIVEKITEKPASDLGLGNLANAGIYIFDSLIFDAIEKTELSIRNEYEFTDSMEILMNQFSGKIVGFVIEDQFWSDIGLPWQLLDANKYLLEKIREKIQGKLEDNVKIDGKVIIGKNTQIRSGSYIKGPCFIGENTIIGPNAFIRSNTSVGNNCVIGMSEVKNSIIFSNTNLPHFNFVGDSIICENVNLGAGTKSANLRLDKENVKMKIKGKQVNTQRKKLGVVIGSNVKIGINSSLMTGKKIGENSWIGAH
ncbi:MAG: NTP transferase domain-containing protein, partial [Candidatus Lokiarchaeota archaeon]|nr:NTP transferase domain-containing protein [Candidatus Lokiarchaeota archaeon]MBD3342570.1 NTP transferase domain-containing protein [Candidatus Lokiarchaeota archaeon]